MPGCPPESHQIAAVIDLVIKVLHGEAELPPKGQPSVLPGQPYVMSASANEIKNNHKFMRIQHIDKIRLQTFACLSKVCLAMDLLPETDAVHCARQLERNVLAVMAQRRESDYGARLITAFASVIG